MSTDFRMSDDIEISPFTLETSVVSTVIGTTDERAFVSANPDEKWHDLWNKLIDWNIDPSHVDEDELESPSPIAIRAAGVLLTKLKQQISTWIPILAPDGEGGISIEYHLPQKVFVLFEVDRDGTTEFMVLVDSKMQTRCRI